MERPSLPLILVSTAAFMLFHTSAHAQLPAHAARLVNPDAPVATHGGGGREVTGSQVSVNGLAWVSTDDNRFDTPLGIEIDYSVVLDSPVQLRFGVGYETWAVKDGTTLGDDVDVVPLGLSALIGSTSADLPICAELGLRYLLVDSGTADLDDALAARVGLEWRVWQGGGTGFKVGAGYQFTIEDAESGVAGVEDVSFDGLRISIGLMGSL